MTEFKVNSETGQIAYKDGKTWRLVSETKTNSETGQVAAKVNGKWLLASDTPVTPRDDDIPQVGDIDQYAAGIRQTMEGEHAQAMAGREAAAENLEFAEKPALERAAASGMEGVQQAITMPAMVVNAPSAIGRIMGLDTPDIMPTGVGYTPEGSVAQIMGRAGGDVVSMGMGMAPVARASGNAGSVVADVMGMGSSVDDMGKVIADQAARNAKHIPDTSQNMAIGDRVDINWNNPEMVQEAAGKASDDVIVEMHRGELALLDEIESTRAIELADIDRKIAGGGFGDVAGKNAEKIEENILAAKAKIHKKADAQVAKVEKELSDQRQGQIGGAMVFGEEFHDSAIKQLARRYDVTEAFATEKLLAAGGLRTINNAGERLNDTLSDVAARVRLNRQEEIYNSTRSAANRKGKNRPWHGIEEWMRPASALLRETVGKGFASQVESAFIQGSTDAQKILTKYQGRMEEFKAVDAWSDTPAIKRQFGDLHITGVEGRAKLINQARKDLTDEQFKLFDDFLDDSHSYSEEMRKYVFAKGEKLDDVHSAMTKRKNLTADAEKVYADGQRGAGWSDGSPNNIGGTAERRRGSMAHAGQDFLDTYESPLTAQLRRMTEDRDIIALHKRLNIPPSLRVGEKLADVNAAVARAVRRDTGDVEKANAAGRVIGSTIKGSRETPHQAVRTFMAQAYGGTLGQFDSAVLNFHDVFTSAWRQGARPTAKAIGQALDDAGITAEKLGISEAHIGEFREGVVKELNNLSTGDKLERLAEGYSKVAFKASMFKAFDMAGKGVILRSTMNDMQRLAKESNSMKPLREKYGHILKDREMGEVAVALRKGTRFEDMTARQQDIMGRAMLTRLGEQQLISTVSRPLAYLERPGLRPIWAMSGFAIRQTDILKMEIVDRAAKGDVSGAAKATAGWLVWSVGGYILTDTFRDQLSAQVSGKESKKATWENTKQRALEGVAGPVTFNKMGDAYSWDKFQQDPVDTLLYNMLIPPSGALGSLGKGAMDLTRGENPLVEWANAVPLAGRLMSDVAKEAAKE
jgi:hypothetical protein